MEEGVPSYGDMLTRSGSADGRSVFVATQMRLRESEYTDVHELTVFVGTWNVNGKPPKESLAPWLIHARFFFFFLFFFFFSSLSLQVMFRTLSHLAFKSLMYRLAP